MIVYDYEDNSVVARELTAEQKKDVVSDIVSKWTQWSEPIGTLKLNRDTVVERSVPAATGCRKDKKKDWHSNIALNRPYEYYNKLYGILYETFYDKISSYLKLDKNRFDAIYNQAFNIENKRYLLVCMKDMLEYGEIVASAELKNTYKKVALPLEEIVNVDPADIVSVRENSFIARQKIGEKINFVRINPCNFAYDPTRIPGTEDFDSCDKIVKQWKTKQEILSNKNYEISRDELDMLIGDQNNASMPTQDKNDVGSVQRYNQIEVLTFYGNFTVNGKYYENYVAVVVGRQYLVYFKPKGIYTPGIYYCPFHQQGNGTRGISPLFYILDLCHSEEKTFNDAVDFIQLQKNPPKYVPNGFFEEEIIKLQPGLNITYNPGMQDPSAIKDIVFNAQPLLLFQEATKQLEKEIGGIDNGQLSEKSEALTEAEVKRIATSDNLIPNMIISSIMLNIISKYLKDCVQIMENNEFDENVVKTAWEYANEQLQMQNIVNVLEKVASGDPTMVNLDASSRKVCEAMGVNPDDYLNSGRNQNILNTFAGLSDEVLQQLAQEGQKLQVDANNRVKASKMMANIQDDLYRKQIRETWEQTGSLPESFIVPNGQANMEVPVESVTPATQVKNKVSTTAN